MQQISNGLRLLNLTVYSLNPEGFNHFEMIDDTYSIKVFFFVSITITDLGQNIFVLKSTSKWSSAYSKVLLKQGW